MSGRVVRLLAAAWTVVGASLAAHAQPPARPDGFPHDRHANVSAACQSCHLGAFVEGRPLWPQPEGCASCHDGTIQKRVAWTPRREPLPTNLTFTHVGHARSVVRKAKADSVVTCTACHQLAGGTWMTVARKQVGTCLDCHAIRTAHYDAPDSSCATCHVSLAASTLTVTQVKAWTSPTPHGAGDFAERGHGALARAADGRSAAASCATCHTQDYCASCHVNAASEPAIASMARDARGLAVALKALGAPATHAAATFLRTHGARLAIRTAAGDGSAATSAQRCQTCHTRESCLACHLVPPRQVQFLSAAAGRTIGAPVKRVRPANHLRDYTDIHAAPASSRPQTCFGCHVRPQCLDCHRPDPGASGGYHPADYLTRHPISAYRRETTCADCHNAGQFCQSCHKQSGLVSTSGNTLGSRSRYHDAFPAFSQGHGQAARQGLENCVTCHTERDCLACHSAIGGRRVSPHGPGFNAAALQKANSQMCSVCHGSAIPAVTTP